MRARELSTADRVDRLLLQALDFERDETGARRAIVELSRMALRAAPDATATLDRIAELVDQHRRSAP